MVIALCFHVQKQYKITVSVYGSIHTKCGFGLVLAPSAVLKKKIVLIMSKCWGQFCMLSLEFCLLVFVGKFQQKHVFSTWNGLTNGWSHVYKLINLVWTNFRALFTLQWRRNIYVTWTQIITNWCCMVSWYHEITYETLEFVAALITITQYYLLDHT